jgi:hypothetical protein
MEQNWTAFEQPGAPGTTQTNWLDYLNRYIGM